MWVSMPHAGRQRRGDEGCRRRAVRHGEHPQESAALNYWSCRHARENHQTATPAGVHCLRHISLRGGRGGRSVGTSAATSSCGSRRSSGGAICGRCTCRSQICGSCADQRARGCPRPAGADKSGRGSNRGHECADDRARPLGHAAECHHIQGQRAYQYRPHRPGQRLHVQPGHRPHVVPTCAELGEGRARRRARLGALRRVGERLRLPLRAAVERRQLRHTHGHHAAST